MFKKEDGKDREVRGGVALIRNGTKSRANKLPQDVVISALPTGREQY